LSAARNSGNKEIGNMTRFPETPVLRSQDDRFGLQGEAENVQIVELLRFH